jgi:indolepyruvate ferredoxin oxidoreductase
LQEKIDFRAGHLAAYQDEAYAGRYRRLVAAAPEELREAVAEGYHKLLAYKDEYEVARLHLATAEKARAEFDGDFRMTVHLAPPFLAKAGPNGRPAKREFGPWMFRAFRLLAAMKGLRGTAFDPFGRGAERRMERALIAEYEADMAEILPKVTPATRDAAVALARLPLDIRGFGPVKEASQARAAKQREELLAVIRAGGAPVQAAAE